MQTGTGDLEFATAARTTPIESDVRAYSLENWHRWEAEKADWFDDDFKACVPDDFIPKFSLDELKKIGGGERRRSRGLFLLVGGESKRKSDEQEKAAQPEGLDEARGTS